MANAEVAPELVQRHRELSEALDPFRRTLARRRLGLAIRRALILGGRLWWWAALALLAWQGLRLLAPGAALGAPTWSLVGVAAALSALAGCALVVLPHPPWRVASIEAARAIDRAADPADRVTNAWCFLAAGQAGAFEQLAIADGLERIAGYPPGELPMECRGRPFGALTGLRWAAVIALAGWSLTWGIGRGGEGGCDDLAAIRRVPVLASGGEQSAVRTPRPRRPRSAAPAPLREGVAAVASERSERRGSARGPGRALRGSDRSSMGSSSGARRDPHAGSQGGSAAAGPAPARQREARRTPRASARPRTRRPRKRGEQRRSEALKSSAVMAAALGTGGSFRAVENPWEDRDPAFERDEEGEAEEGEIDDEQSQSKQRGGVQPSKKDRRASPSRDLSLGLGKKPGNGRGGPSPQKKARGTAALVLGRRLPEFVPGTPNPGTSKVDTQPTLPSRRPLDAGRKATAMHFPPAAPARLRPDGIPPEFKDLVRRLFERRAAGTQEMTREQH